MKKTVWYQCIIIYGSVLLSVLPKACDASLAYNDPNPYHLVYGNSTFYQKPQSSRFSFHLTPFYSYADKAYMESELKINLGNRLGHLNMAGLLFGLDPAKYDFPTATDRETPLYKAYDGLASSGVDMSRWLPGVGHLDDGSQGIAHYHVIASYKKLGMRAECVYALENGFSLFVKGGGAEVSFSPQLVGNPGRVADAPDGSLQFQAMMSGEASAADQFLLAPSVRNDIAKEVGLVFDPIQKTTLEDVSVGGAWGKHYRLQDRDKEHVVTLIPTLKGQVTVPVADERDTKNIFDFSLGNNGFYAFTGSASISFDFPGTMQVGGGARFTCFDSQVRKDQRVPTHSYQRVLFPYTTNVVWQPGNTWELYGTLQARNFIDKMTAYCDYTYTVHQADDIQLEVKQTGVFYPELLQKTTNFNAHTLFIGMDYHITDALHIGGAFQTVVNGKQVWKVTTLSLSLSFVF